MLLTTGVACGGRDSAGDARDSAATPRGFPPPPTAPYEVVSVSGGGLVTGQVRLVGDAPRDTMVRAVSDEAVCGRGHVEPMLTVTDGMVSGAIVWLHDIRAGKRLPVERLFEVLQAGCRLTPRVQAVLTGGTLNVRSADNVPHRTRFLHLHTNETLTLIRQTDAGSVVPNRDAVSRTGLVQMRCDVHPWTTGWIAVFDHPYFVMTDLGGHFALTEVPPGRYMLVVWHERLGSVMQEVVVGTGTATEVDIAFRR